MRRIPNLIRSHQYVRSYHQNVIDHFNNPRNVGSLDKTKKNVGIGLAGAPACGDFMKLSIEVDDDGFIKDSKFKVFGCGSAISASSYATELIKGKHIEEAAEIKNSVIANELHLPVIKLHCSLLAEQAIHLAVKDYKKKNDLFETGSVRAATLADVMLE